MHEAESVDIAEQGDTGVRKLPIFEQIYAMDKKVDRDDLSGSDCSSERGEDSMQTASTGSPNDSLLDLDKSCFDDIVESLCGGSESDQQTPAHAD